MPRQCMGLWWFTGTVHGSLVVHWDSAWVSGGSLGQCMGLWCMLVHCTLTVHNYRSLVHVVHWDSAYRSLVVHWDSAYRSLVVHWDSAYRSLVLVHCTVQSYRSLVVHCTVHISLWWFTAVHSTYYVSGGSLGQCI